MRKENIKHQSEQFLSYYKKLGGDLRKLFEFWAGSKDFSVNDRNKILTAVKIRRAEELPLIASLAQL